MKPSSLTIAVTLALSTTGLSIPVASAATDCAFVTGFAIMTLDADCTTDETLFIPNGFTLDGKGNTVTAVDPSGGHFLGAVVKNAGPVAYVRNLIIDTDGLSNACDGAGPPDNRLRGILLESATGIIEKNTVLNLNQGESGCQEGNAIEVRNPPFDGTHPNTQVVEIRRNTVDAYQKSGIFASGDVLVEIERNNASGLGPIDYIAQNGIQLGFGAVGTVTKNKVSGNVYTPQTYASGGILIYNADLGVEVEKNTVDASDVGIWWIGTSMGSIEKNKVFGATWDGLALDDQSGSAVSGNLLKGNRAEGNDIGIGLYGDLVTDNESQRNRARKNLSAGIYASDASSNVFYRENLANNLGDGLVVYGDDNVVQSGQFKNNDGVGIYIEGGDNLVAQSVARGNGALDIENVGDNDYTGNKCQTSSGAPVDCGTASLAPLAAEKATDKREAAPYLD